MHQAGCSVHAQGKNAQSYGQTIQEHWRGEIAPEQRTAQPPSRKNSKQGRRSFDKDLPVDKVGCKRLRQLLGLKQSK